MKKIQLLNGWGIPKDYPELEELILSGSPDDSSVIDIYSNIDLSDRNVDLYSRHVREKIKVGIEQQAGYTMKILKDNVIKKCSFSSPNLQKRKISIVVESSKLESINFINSGSLATCDMYIKIPKVGVTLKELHIQNPYILMNFNEVLSSGCLYNVRSLKLDTSENSITVIENLPMLEVLMCSNITKIYNCCRLEEVKVLNLKESLEIQKCCTLKKLTMRNNFRGINISSCFAFEEIVANIPFLQKEDVPNFNFENTTIKRIFVSKIIFLAIARNEQKILSNVKKIVIKDVIALRSFKFGVLLENISKFPSLNELICNNIDLEDGINVKKEIINHNLKKLCLKISDECNENPKSSYDKMPFIFPSLIELKIDNIQHFRKSIINNLNKVTNFRMIQFIDLKIKRSFGKKSEKIVVPLILDFTKRVVSFVLTYDLERYYYTRKYEKFFSGPSSSSWDEGIILDMNERKQLLNLKIDHEIYLKNHSGSNLKDISFLCKNFKFKSIKNSGKFNLLEIRHCKEYDVINEKFIRNILEQTEEIYILSFRGGFSTIDSQLSSGRGRKFREKVEKYYEKLEKISDFKEYKKIQEIFPNQIIVFEN